jgi:hypothetical protein
MAAGPLKGEPLARMLRARGCALSAGEAALLAERRLSLIAQGLIVPVEPRGEVQAPERPAEEPTP